MKLESAAAPRIQINNTELFITPTPESFGDILKFIQTKFPDIFLNDVKLSWKNPENNKNITMSCDQDLQEFYLISQNTPIKVDINTSIYPRFLNSFDLCISKLKENRGWFTLPFEKKFWSPEEAKFFDLIEEGKLICSECWGTCSKNLSTCTNCFGSGFIDIPVYFELIFSFINYKFWKLHGEKYTSSTTASFKRFDFEKDDLQHNFFQIKNNEMSENLKLSQRKASSNSPKSYDLLQSNTWQNYCKKKNSSETECPLKRPALNIQILNLKSPAFSIVGQPYCVDLTIKNVGTSTPFPVGTFITNHSENGVHGHKIPLPELAPGATYQFQLHGNAPTKPGRQKIEWRFSTNNKMKCGIYFKEKIIFNLDVQNLSL